MFSLRSKKQRKDLKKQLDTLQGAGIDITKMQGLSASSAQQDGEESTYDVDEEINILNVISLNSSARPSPEAKEETTSSSAYSNFEEGGSSGIENPTSYFLETDSDDEDYDDQVSNPDSKGLHKKYQDLEKGTDGERDGVSSVHSSQATIILPETQLNEDFKSSAPLSEAPTQLVNTPERFHNPTPTALQSAPVFQDSYLADAVLSQSAKSLGALLTGDSAKSGINADILSPKSVTIPPLGEKDGIVSPEPLNIGKPQLESPGWYTLKTPEIDFGNKNQDYSKFDPEDVSDWNRTVPALPYENSIHASHKTENSSNWQNLQETLLRGNGSIVGPQKDYLDVIKTSLSRNRSFRSTNFGSNSIKEESPPLLFSQNRKSISRSTSIRRTRTKNSKTASELKLTGERDADDFHDDRYNAERNKSNNSNAEDTHKREELSSSGTVITKSDPRYNPLTETSDLNCLKDGKKSDLDSRFFHPDTGVPPMFQEQRVSDAEKIKNAEEINEHRVSKGFGGFKSDNGRNGEEPESWISRLKRPPSDKFYSLLIWTLIMIIIVILCTLVPLLLVYERGTEATTMRYLSNISTNRRDQLLKGFYPQGYTTSSMTKTKPMGNQTTPSGNDTSSSVNNYIGPLSIAGISKFENIPLRYQRNKEIQLIMDNSALRNVFYGIDYAPRNVIYPVCGATMHEVMLDVAQLSQVTSRIRTYGTQCNQAKFILDSIKTLNLNVSLAMGVWIGPNDDINQLQIQDMKSLLQSYPRKYFESVLIGNEVLFREEQTPEALARYVEDAKKFILKDLKWDLPVGTSELGTKSSPEVIKVSDIYGSNSHPFFTGETVQTATKWVYDFMKFQIEPMQKHAQNGTDTKVIISEVGWPYSGGKYKKSVAGKRHMQYFLNSWICEAKENSYPWYFFEAYDEPWKQIYHDDNSKWETEWGLFTADRKMKEGIVIPTCNT